MRVADGALRCRYSWFDHYPTQPEPPQFWVYNRCISRYGHKHRFMAFIDTDEFLVLQDHRYKRLPDFLRNYEPFGGEWGARHRLLLQQDIMWSCEPLQCSICTCCLLWCGDTRSVGLHYFLRSW